MKFKATFAILAILSAVLLAGTASALSWQDAIIVNNLMNRGDYDVVWEGPYKGGNLLVTFNGNKQSALSSADLSGNDLVIYQRNDVTSYSSSGRYGYSNRYNGYNSGYSSYYNQPRSYFGNRGASNYFRDNSESLIIDNRASVIANAEVTNNAIALASGARYIPNRGYYNWRY